ncbi:MAG: 4Fe-4S binding protein [Agathobacter sp.]|nr:4Fe-4S binding protein [Agathobacter sp.]
MACLNLKKSNCKNCYKCIRHCPVKAIRFSGNQAHIMKDACILCGQCFVVCPQNAKEIVSEIEKVKVLLQGEHPVIVSLAPSFIANYEGVGIGAMREAVKKLGFFDVEETAIGATIVKNEYERMLKEEQRDVVIASCCPSVNLLIQRYFPKAVEYLADVVSPMIAHCQDVKKRYPDAKTVFIGPCVSKKYEAETSGGIVDAVLTFEELSNWLQEEQIQLEQKMDEDSDTSARFFPVAGGILRTMKNKPSDYAYIEINGVEKCMSALRDIEAGNVHKCFIEMSSCVGSCIGGPVMEKYHQTNIIKDYISVANYAGEKDFDVLQPKAVELKKQFEFVPPEALMPSEAEINAALRRMGKYKESDELNCGTCGYNTCREKAIAVCQGKAQITMCLPFLKQKAESFSDAIVRNTSNGIVVLNENLEVQQINEAARKMMNIRFSSDILGEPVVRILDPVDFVEVLYNSESIENKRVYLAEYQRFVEESIIYDNDSHLLICIMRDVTEEEKNKEKRERISRDTIEVADKVVEKQMRIVQEIASLLGETAAETKIALTKLKESIENE